MAGSETKWVDHWQKKRDETLHENEILARGAMAMNRNYFSLNYSRNKLVNFTEYSFFPWEKSVVTLLLLTGIIYRNENTDPNFKDVSLWACYSRIGIAPL